MAADESIRNFSWKIWKRFGGKDEDPFISEDSLKWASDKHSAGIESPPACGPIMEEMQATFAEWICDPNPSRWLQLVVLPPADTNDLLRTWAIEHDHRIIDPPPRESLLDHSKVASVPLDCENTLVVIPQLERWFLRHQDGMMHVRRLLLQASKTKRHLIIGCNSWAWQFLNKAVSAGRLLPLGLTFNAFDADRLRNWLMPLSQSDNASEYVFRQSKNGLIADSDYFAKLAARSLGIPWIAWHLWHRAIRVRPSDQNIGHPKFPDEQTRWVSELEDLSLPIEDVDAALLTLQALLIHGGLTEEELDLATPSVDASNVLPSLVEADFVAHQNDGFQCKPDAYPAIRSRLVSAGFPEDKL